MVNTGIIYKFIVFIDNIRMDILYIIEYIYIATNILPLILST